MTASNLDAFLKIGFLALMVLLPGGAVVTWVIPRVGVLARLGAALALSPALTGGVIALLAYAGMGIGRSGILVLGVSCLFVITGVLRESRRRRNAARGERSDSGESVLVTLIFAIAAGILVGSFSLMQEWWRVFADAWLHGPYVESIIARGIPPGDPDYAGLVLNYHWIYHAFVASVTIISGMDPFRVMAWLQIFAIISVVLSLGSCAHRIHGRRVGWTLAFVLLGLNAFFPIFILAFTAVRAAVGDVRGIQEFGRMYPFRSLGWSESSVFLRLLGGQALFLDKFMVTTPMALSIAAVCAWAGSFWRWFDASAPAREPAETGNRTGAKGDLLLAAFLTLSAGLLHAVVGPALLATSLGILLLVTVGRPIRICPPRAAWQWTLAVVIGFAPVAPYLSTLIERGGGHDQLPLDLAPMKIIGLITCLAAGFVFGLRPARRLFAAGGAGRVWITWLLTMLCMALIVRIPGPSPFFTVDKFSYLVWIPLALTAGASFGDALTRFSIGWRIVLAALLFLPVNGFALVSRIADPHAHRVQPWSLPEYVWMRRHLPRDAVLLTPLGDMNTVVFARRDQYYADHVLQQLCGYPAEEMSARRRLLDRLYGEGRIDSTDLALLEELGRPVYAVWFDSSSPIWNFVPGSLPHVRTGPGQKPPWDDRFPTVYESGLYTIAAVTKDAEESLERGDPPDRRRESDIGEDLERPAHGEGR